MFISVVMPLYNKAPYVSRAVESVLKQTHDNLELIVVDDGSKDDGAEIVASVDDPRIRLIRQSNQGVSVARNRGVSEAKADWVAFLDADDEYYPEFLERVASFIEENNDAMLSFIGTNCYRGDPSSTSPDTDFATGIYDDYFVMYQNGRCPNNSSSTVVRKKCLLEVGGFPAGQKQLEDWTTWSNLAFHGSFGYVGVPLTICHRVEGSASRAVRPPAEFFNDINAMLNTLLEGADKLPEGSEVRKSALRFRNELIMQLARKFVFQGQKKWCLLLLRKFRVGSFRINQIEGSVKMIICLLLPYISVKNYRNIKGRIVH